MPTPFPFIIYDEVKPLCLLGIPALFRGSYATFFCRLRVYLEFYIPERLENRPKEYPSPQKNELINIRSYSSAIRNNVHED
jgi:hypothetical protein